MEAPKCYTFSVTLIQVSCSTLTTISSSAKMIYMDKTKQKFRMRAIRSHLSLRDMKDRAEAGLNISTGRKDTDVLFLADVENEVAHISYSFILAVLADPVNSAKVDDCLRKLKYLRTRFHDYGEFHESSLTDAIGLRDEIREKISKLEGGPN